MSEIPYLLVSDIHGHAWSAFSTVNEVGINSRLQTQLDELERAADELLARGGKLMIFAGDLFHVRGSVDPEVFNPVHATLTRIVEKGVQIIAIPGNHDLKGKETSEIGNSFQSMSNIGHAGVRSRKMFVITASKMVWGGDDDHYIAMIPWCSTNAALREQVEELKASINADTLPNTDLIIHAGIDGVIDGLPAGGLSAVEVAKWGFRRVFAGHYHNHKVMEGGKVVSIGATTHQTWSDIGSKAGYVLVYPGRIDWRATHAPEFVEISGEDEPEEIPMIVDGNYVRIRGMKLSNAEIIKFRAELEGMGARGVSFQVAREAVSARAGAVAGTTSTLDESVDKYIDSLTEIDVAAVKAESAEVLNQVRSVVA